MDQNWKAGLEDVIAARSAICRVDGEAGRLYYRGYEIGELGGGGALEDVTALLWFGGLPRSSSGGSLHGRRSPGRSAATRRRGCPASATGSTKSTMPALASCAGWRSPWRRPPVGRGSSRWPSACTTRCAR